MADDERLGKAVRVACSRSAAGAALQVASAHAPHVMHLMVVPLPEHHGLAQVLADPLALVIASDPHAPHLGVAAYQGLSGLTDAESALLNALVNGKTLESWASERGVSRNTVRTQLSSVFAKTGVDSQPRLIRLAKTLPAVASSILRTCTLVAAPVKHAV